MNDRLLQGAQNPALRLWVALGVALGTGAVAGLPALDGYVARRGESRRLAKELAEYRDSLARLPELEKLMEQRDGPAHDSASQASSGDASHSFRSRVVELSRQARCQVRQIQLGEHRQGDWKKGDPPLQVPNKSSQEVKGPYVLESQAITISLTGSLANVKQFMHLLAEEHRLIHTRRLSLKPSPDAAQITLELEILLLELDYVQPPAA